MAADFQTGLEAYKRGNYATALEEWRPLAEQGLARAQHDLGFMYDNGEGVAQDHSEAARWYRLAAEQGLAEAQNNLGVLYEDGESDTRDNVKALMWYSLAAARFPPGEDRDTAVRNRKIVATQMTPEQLAEAQRLASEWKPK